MSDETPPAETLAVKLGDLVPLETIERLHIEAVIASTEALVEAAKILQIDPATLYRKRLRWGAIQKRS